MATCSNEEKRFLVKKKLNRKDFVCEISLVKCFILIECSWTSFCFGYIGTVPKGQPAAFALEGMSGTAASEDGATAVSGYQDTVGTVTGKKKRFHFDKMLFFFLLFFF